MLIGNLGSPDRNLTTAESNSAVNAQHTENSQSSPLSSTTATAGGMANYHLALASMKPSAQDLMARLNPAD